MPVIFSPGEPETRPLDPEAIVYTTAQKVADLLSIGPQEAVLMSANAEANAVFVTGGDYRNIGFSVGDTILIYSDADPMGQEHAITAITTSASGVKLAFAASINPGLYETADNAYVQNTASFTNGKTRGMKKSVVETRIKEVQERIDNITHNAWRPYLAVAEYINFDTYKPYRRRYYTDYVGTAPLLFRNVQQILRLEVWQGENYRELAGAEARIEISDHNGLSGDAMYLCPGGGGFAKLAVGTGTQQWESNFNTVTTAQNLADLVNNEDRTNRGTVTFTTDATSPSGTTYTQPDGSSSTGTTNVHVHNEFIATANSDYGNGKLKVTSMQPVKGGETATIAVSDATSMVITDTGSTTTTFSKVQAADFTVGGAAYNNDPTVTHTSSNLIKLGMRVIGSGIPDNAIVASITSATEFELNVSTTGGSKSGQTLTFSSVMVYSSDVGGTGYTTASGVATTGGTGTGMTVDITHIMGGLATVTINASGSGYTSGDVITISAGSGDRRFIIRTPVTDEITGTDISGFKDFGVLTLGSGTSQEVIGYTGKSGSKLTGCVELHGTPINPAVLLSADADGQGTLDNGAASGTQLAFGTDIGQYSDAGGDQARLKDWWLDHEMGIIYFNNSYPFFEWNAIKATYVYGERYLEKAIEEAATKLVAADLLMSDDRSVLIPEGSQNVDLGAKIQLYRKEAEEILSRYKEVVVFA